MIKISKKLKKLNNSSAVDIQKTPENSQNTPLQEKPINTRGEKYTTYVLIPTQTTLIHIDIKNNLQTDLYGY